MKPQRTYFSRALNHLDEMEDFFFHFTWAWRVSGYMPLELFLSHRDDYNRFQFFTTHAQVGTVRLSGCGLKRVFGRVVSEKLFLMDKLLYFSVRFFAAKFPSANSSRYDVRDPSCPDAENASHVPLNCFQKRV